MGRRRVIKGDVTGPGSSDAMDDQMIPKLMISFVRGDPQQDHDIGLASSFHRVHYRTLTETRTEYDKIA